MRAFLGVLGAFSLLFLGVSDAMAQFGRPGFIPRFTPRPPIRPPIHVPPLHLPPAHTPHFPSRTPIGRDPQNLGIRPYGEGPFFYRLTKRAVQAASTVGLLAAPQGQGPLLHAASLVPGSLAGSTDWSFDYHPPVDSEQVALAASMIGLLTAPLGQGPLLSASTLLPRPLPDPGIKQEQNLFGESKVENGMANARPPEAGTVADHLVWIIPVLIGVAIVFSIFRAALRREQDEDGSTVRVRIVAVPPGEAPEPIRRAWIGLELYARPDGSSQEAFGVLSNRQTSCQGYAVNGAEAVARLAAQSPDAADWWRRHAPHVLAGDYQLVFPAQVCEVL